MHKRYSGIRGKLKEDSMFKCQVCAYKQTDIAEDCPSIDLNGKSLKIFKKFCYLCDTKGASGSASDRVATMIRSG